jgi:hypothetical protein
MRIPISLLLILSLCTCTSTPLSINDDSVVRAQEREAVQLRGSFSADDIPNFWRAHELVVATKDSSESVTYEVSLEPGREYEMELGVGYRTLSGYRLVPYLIEFQTSR